MSEETQQPEVSLWEMTQVRAEEHFVPNINECIRRGKEEYPDKDFYLMYINVPEPDMMVILRDKFQAFSNCPSPQYNQIVFKYTLINDHLDLLWTLPPEEHCKDYLENAEHVSQDEQMLLGFIKLFEDGTLNKLANQLNGE